MSLNPVIPMNTRVPEWTVAERLRKGRRDAHLTQADIAARLGIKESRYSAWETGRNTPDIAELAPKLEEITGVSRLFYIGWLDSNNPPPGGGVTARYRNRHVSRPHGTNTFSTHRVEGAGQRGLAA